MIKSSSRASGMDPTEITSEESSQISTSGYYGKPVEEEHAQMLFEHRPYEIAGYAVHYSGYDGTDTMRFGALEEAANYINDRLPERFPSRLRGTTFRTEEGAHYELEGFTFNDMQGLDLESPNVIDHLQYHPDGDYWDS